MNRLLTKAFAPCCLWLCAAFIISGCSGANRTESVAGSGLDDEAGAALGEAAPLPGAACNPILLAAETGVPAVATVDGGEDRSFVTPRYLRSEVTNLRFGFDPLITLRAFSTTGATTTCIYRRPGPAFSTFDRAIVEVASCNSQQGEAEPVPVALDGVLTASRFELIAPDSASGIRRNPATGTHRVFARLDEVVPLAPMLVGDGVRTGTLALNPETPLVPRAPINAPSGGVTPLWQVFYALGEETAARVEAGTSFFTANSALPYFYAFFDRPRLGSGVPSENEEDLRANRYPSPFVTVDTVVFSRTLPSDSRQGIGYSEALTLPTLASACAALPTVTQVD